MADKKTWFSINITNWRRIIMRLFFLLIFLLLCIGITLLCTSYRQQNNNRSISSRSIKTPSLEVESWNEEKYYSEIFGTFDKSESFDINRMKLLRAIKLLVRTKTGEELKPFIDELLQQDKIRLTKLPLGHYGESGEGCIVKEGEYYYEGLFVMLNDALTSEEIASSLVHEVIHYRMIKNFAGLNFNFPVKVMDFEISSFATQYKFISELESLNLIDSQLMFTDDSKTVLEIMQNAFNLKNNWSEKDYDHLFNQLVDYGYPSNELNRIISQRSEKNCFGMVN